MRPCLCSFALALVASATPAIAQPSSDTPTKPTSTAAEEQKPDSPSGVRFVMKKPPSLVFGEAARIDFRFKVHTDYRSFSPDLRTEDRLDLRRVRAGIEGMLLKNVEYEIDYDFREEEHPLRDAFLDVRILRPLQVRAGKFKLPFSREQLTGIMNLDFAFRSRAADALAPGRSIGGMVHGRVFDRRVQYQVGMFREDGENGRPPFETVEGLDFVQIVPPPNYTRSPMFAARTTLRVAAAGGLKDIEIGGAMTTGHVEGRQGIRGRMLFGGGFFPAMEVNGRRQRVGLELSAGAGPVTLQGEWMHLRDERHGQGIDNEDLGAMSGRGWYAAATWLAAGTKPGGGADRPPASAFGAVELVARIESLRFGGPTDGDEPSRSPRAVSIFPNTEGVLTFGTNWYINELVRLQGNVMRERLEDAVRAPVPGHQVFWSTILRFQFAL